MKKIGILTYHKQYNYGTVLQAYALQKYISNKFDVDIEIIDYTAKNEYVGKKLFLTRVKRIGFYISHLSKYIILYLNKNNQRKRIEEFEQFFLKDLVMSAKSLETQKEIANYCKKYDAIIIGSDQTWNPYVGQVEDFLINYITNEKIIKLSYAPSIGIKRIPDDYKDLYAEALSKFKALSCREFQGAKNLSSILNRNVEFVLDPTLLLNKDQWGAVASEVFIKDPYLLVYFLGDNKEYRKFVEKIALMKGLKIVALPMSYLEMKKENIDKQYVGPKSFLSLVKNAALICTDSFHGTMFSINFEKQFIVFPKRSNKDIKSDNSRIYDALKVFDLEDCLWNGASFIIKNIDYVEVNQKLEKLRNMSYKYLEKALSII